MTDKKLQMFRRALSDLLDTYQVELVCSDPYESVMFIPITRHFQFNGRSGAGPTCPSDISEYPEDW